MAQRAHEAGARQASKLVTLFGVNAADAHNGLRVACEDDGIAIVPLTTLGP